MERILNQSVIRSGRTMRLMGKIVVTLAMSEHAARRWGVKQIGQCFNLTGDSDGQGAETQQSRNQKAESQENYRRRRYIDPVSKESGGPEDPAHEERVSPSR